MDNTLELLLKMELPRPEIKKIKIKRLSKLCGEDIVFEIRQLSYNRVAEIKESGGDDISVDILLAGVVEPNFKDKELKEKFGAETPAELVKKMLLPGEIEDISRAVEKLCGYRVNTIEEISLEEKVEKK